MKNYNIETNLLFADQIFNTQIDESFCDVLVKKINKDKHEWKKGLKNVNALTTGWNGLKKYDELKEISTLICKILLPKIGKVVNWKYDNWRAHEAWINFYQKGDATSIHNHRSVDYCGVLILKPGEGDLLFHNPKFVERQLKAFEQVEDQRLNEKRGTLILFPSYLYHSVTECKTERISVAFNFFNDVI
jgi:hypothetical protein